MIRFNLFFKNFLIVVRKNLVGLVVIDIIIFSFFVNTNYFSFLQKALKIPISVFLIQNSLTNYSFTKYLEPIFLISGRKIKKLVLINFFFNNFFFLGISLLLLIVKLTTFQTIGIFLYILNLLIFISFILKFILPLERIKDSFFRNSIKTILLYILFALFSVGLLYLNLSIIIIISIFFITINYFNRSLYYNDIN